ncbi:MAG: DNA polymerase III subunit gamma/tau [Clostridia bacterium]|nr:DNA polymerase III subunit gamma/tau [Clostridia bacterium]
MAYQALYRKYRPKRFMEVIGQEHITTILKNQIAEGHVAHAYLFTGTRGTGKTSTAKIFAKALNCDAPKSGEPCGECASCRIAEAGNVDIIELDAASNTGVEDMRALIDKARFAPLDLRVKVYIIDEAHMLSKSAFNALLKTLEEPPAHVVFILATTEPQSIPATIVSRCQRFDFHRLRVADITACMEGVLQNAGASIEKEGMLAIARAAEGGMRDALSLADQCISFCGGKVTAEDVYGVLGSMESDFLFDVAEALITDNRDAALRLLERVVNEGRDLSVFAQDLARHFRALLLAKLCGHCSDIIDCTEDAMRRYIEQAKHCGEKRLSRAIDILLGATANLKWLALPRVQLECAFVRITTPEEEPHSVDLLLERIEQLEAKVKNGIPVQAAPVQAAPQKAESAKPSKAETDDRPPWEDAPIPAAEDDYVPPSDMDAPPVQEEEPPAAKPTPAAGDPKALWEAARSALQKKNPTLAVLALKAVEFHRDGDTLVVAFDKKAFYDAFSKAENHKLTADALAETAGNMKLRFIMAGESAATPALSLEDAARKAFGSMLEIID